ncbi:HNH endonuclease signature motif containing protein [Mesorhizobium sp. M0106]|uniref:HNH endonuclease signature motif containing protein n=1 Tax=Mesorhizobium sp. M0106 TaxID=2956880 RepID=UPI0033382931
MCIQTLRRAALIAQTTAVTIAVILFGKATAKGSLEPRISTNLRRRFRATAEHLIPRSEGGPDIRRNIVAACLQCNTARHRAAVPLGHKDYQSKVAQAVLKGKWHPASALKIGGRRSLQNATGNTLTRGRAKNLPARACGVPDCLPRLKSYNY